jgi:hypothetical protein
VGVLAMGLVDNLTDASLIESAERTERAADEALRAIK